MLLVGFDIVFFLCGVLRVLDFVPTRRASDLVVVVVVVVVVAYVLEEHSLQL